MNSIVGENPQQYFSCPKSPSPAGMTRYALVQYGDTTGDSGDTVAGSRDVLLLFESAESVACAFRQSTV
ncbi:MAG: hypothetical protein FWE95_05645 [Planctomycetaceae bacterium]|nr:hypothetical protein [Planctomycetaceae bacterium]